MTRRVGILFFPGFDLIDSGGPYEVFLTASRLSQRQGGPALYEIVPVGVEGGEAVAYGGLTVSNLVAAKDAGPLDVVVIPGTIDVSAALANDGLREAVGILSGSAQLVTAVCTGAFLLADAGVLEGLGATTHWEDLVDLDSGSVGSVIGPGARWVDSGDVVTSGGLTSGIHMSLHIVARHHGDELALKTAKQLDLVWDPSGASDVDYS